jgi:hypothetical protein
MSKIAQLRAELERLQLWLSMIEREIEIEESHAKQPPGTYRTPLHVVDHHKVDDLDTDTVRTRRAAG